MQKKRNIDRNSRQDGKDEIGGIKQKFELYEIFDEELNDCNSEELNDPDSNISENTIDKEIFYFRR